MRDGSGLSRYDFVTARSRSWRSSRTSLATRSLREPFEATLPIAGRDGTLVDAHARDAGGGQRAREDRIDDRRARHRRLRHDRRRRAAGVLDRRQQLRNTRRRRQRAATDAIARRASRGSVDRWTRVPSMRSVRLQPGLPAAQRRTCFYALTPPHRHKLLGYAPMAPDIAMKQEWNPRDSRGAISKPTLTRDARLVADEASRSAATLIRRLDTPFPLEYAYALSATCAAARCSTSAAARGRTLLLLARRGRASRRRRHLSVADRSWRGAACHANGRRRRRAASSSAPRTTFPIRAATRSTSFFGIAILHHLDLAVVRAGGTASSNAGGRAIFQEPVRDSRLVRAIREVHPHRAPDMSPFERPLDDARSCASSAGSFSSSRMRPVFTLPSSMPPRVSRRSGAYAMSATAIRSQRC